MNLKTVCRTCLKDVGVMLPIYGDGTTNNEVLANLITTISDTTASELDGLPGQICIECVDNLKISTKFKQRCENSYETLKSILGIYIETTKPSSSMSLVDDNIVATVTNFDNSFRMNNFTETIMCGPNEKCIQTEDICFYPCEMCELKFFNEEALKDHRSSHKIKESGYKCRSCDRHYTRLSHLRRHINAAHPEVVISGKLEDIRCKFCEKHFTRHDDDV